VEGEFWGFIWFVEGVWGLGFGVWGLGFEGWEGIGIWGFWYVVFGGICW